MNQIKDQSGHSTNLHITGDHLKPLVKIAAALATIMALTSCSPNLAQSGSSAASSNAAGASEAECNSFNIQSPRLGGKITTYYFNDVLQNNHARVRISAIDARFLTDSTSALQFYRWRVAANGTQELDSTPLSFWIENAADGTSPISPNMTSISADDIATLQMQAGLPASTLQSYFDSTVIVVAGVDESWSAMKAVLGTPTGTITQVDFLIPSFVANPMVYVKSHPAMLNSLHPFISQLGQNSVTDAAWLARAKPACF